MNKRFSYDNMIKSRSIEPSDIIRTFKLDRCCDFMEEKYNHPKLTQKQICDQLGVTDRTIRRFRNDINMDSPYRINNHKKKAPRQKLPTLTENISKNENTKPVIDQASKNKIFEKRIKNRLKNQLKAGNVTNTHTLSTNEIIDYAFQNNYSEDKHLNGKELIENAFNTTIND